MTNFIRIDFPIFKFVEPFNLFIFLFIDRLNGGPVGRKLTAKATALPSTKIAFAQMYQRDYWIESPGPHPFWTRFVP